MTSIACMAASLACSRVTNLACRKECLQMMFTITSPAKRKD